MSDISDMEARVQAAVAEEQRQGGTQEKDVVTPDFVAKCSNFREKGDGLLHSALFRGRFVYVPECRQWYDMSAKNFTSLIITRIIFRSPYGIAHKLLSSILGDKDNMVSTRPFRMCQRLFFRHKKTPFR